MTLETRPQAMAAARPGRWVLGAMFGISTVVLSEPLRPFVTVS